MIWCFFRPLNARSIYTLNRYRIVLISTSRLYFKFLKRIQNVFRDYFITTCYTSLLLMCALTISVMTKRLKPNVLVCGTPGTGKTTVCKLLMTRLADSGFDNYKYLEVSEFCRENDCIKSRDTQLNCDIIDEKKLAKKLRAIIENGFHVIDYHSSDLFPKKLIDFVYVIRCNNTELYDRLKLRNYSDNKIQNNVECEIFEMMTTEAIDWFGKRLVTQLVNEKNDDLSRNVDLIFKSIVDYNKLDD